ncbi:MAG: peptidoglycan recognition family protein [Acidobacteriota bacterium]
MRIKKLNISLTFGLLLTIGVLFGENNTNFSTLTAQNLINENISKITPPTIIFRKDWKAKNPVGIGKEHSISYITIHHTATLQKKDVSIEKKMQNLQNFSQSESRLASGKLKPVWFDIPYHYYIAVDGKIAEGREINFAGDTNTEYDPTGHALIVLEGNFETEKVSDEQQKSLEGMVIWLADKYKVSADKIKGHDDFAKTACPGKNLKVMLPILREKVKD